MPSLPYSARLLPLALLLAACEPPRPDAVATSSPADMRQLEGTWLAVPEEAHGDTLVYRPNTYRFSHPAARTGFRIGPFGRFEQYELAPTGGLTGHEGTWTAEGRNRLRLHFEGGQPLDYTLEIVALHGRGKQQVLRVRR